MEGVWQAEKARVREEYPGNAAAWSGRFLLGCHEHSGVVCDLIFKIDFELDLKELYQLSLDFQKLPSRFDVYYQIELLSVQEIQKARTTNLLTEL